MSELKSARKQFRVKLESVGPKKAWTFLTVPFDVQKVFGTRARVPVRGTINGSSYRSSLFPMGGQHTMMINKAMLAGAQAKPGQVVRVVMETDTAERHVTIPAALKKLLASNREAKLRFEKLSYTHRKEYARWIAEAKKPETRARRLHQVVPMLMAGKHL